MAYDSAGTVEFIVDDETGDFFFLEMNTRLQVEHPVTEEITGLDIVELMIRSAQDEPLAVSQGDVTWNGHAFECRINAENPATDFSPDIGAITTLRLGFDGGPFRQPTGRFRWDAAVRQGDEVTPYYDSMIAKLVVWDTDRDAALATLRSHLDGLRIDGLVTTAPFHRWLVEQQPVVDGRVTTRFLDETSIPADPSIAVAHAARAWGRGSTAAHSVFGRLDDFRLTPHRPDVPLVLRSVDGELHDAKPSEWAAAGSVVREGFTTPEHAPPAHTWVGGDRAARARVDQSGRTVTVTIDDYPHRFTVPERSEVWAGDAAGGAAQGDAVVAPFPGAVTDVHVAAGDTVTAGQPCVVIEAMKMLHTLTSPIDGTVAEVTVAVGDQVAGKHVLVTFDTDKDTAP